MQIVGASADTPAENQSWAEAQGFGFELWSDANTELALYYGAASSQGQGWYSRVTMLLDAGGSLILEYAPVSDVSVHPEQVLADCRILFGR